MIQFSNTLIGIQCVIIPVVAIIFMFLFYFMAVGSLNIGGIARQKLEKTKHWITVTDLTRKFMQFFASVTLLIGALVAFAGYVGPWVSAYISADFGLLDLGSVHGSVSGLALMVASFAGAVGAFKAEGALFAGLVLLLIGLLLLLFTVILLVLLVVAVLRLISHLGYTKDGTVFLKPAMVVNMAAFVIGFIFLLLLLLVGGAKVEMEMVPQIELASGFWFTIGGLFIALVGNIWASKLTEMFAGWIETLTGLKMD
jgi:hypothetical protein